MSLLSKRSSSAAKDDPFAVASRKIVRNKQFPPMKCRIFTSDYVFLPLKQRGVVGLKEIGTVHQMFPDIILCTFLATPGLIYIVSATYEPIWLRVLVCVESLVCGVVATVADGMLLYQSTDATNRIGLIGYDRITSMIHVQTLIMVALYRAFWSYISSLQFALALAIGLVSLFFFHRRLYFSYVEQEWEKARFCARVWHIGGIISSTIILAPRFG